MAAKTSSILSGKVAGVPKPVVLLVVAVAAFFLLRRLKSAGSTTSSSAGTNATPTSADNTQYPSTPSDGTGGGASGVQAADLSALLDALQSGLQNPATGAPSTYNYYYYNSTTPGMDTAGGGNVTSKSTTEANTPTQPTTSYTPFGSSPTEGDYIPSGWAGSGTLSAKSGTGLTDSYPLVPSSVFTAPVGSIVKLNAPQPKAIPTASGAAAVKSGTAKVNYQAKKNSF